MALIVMLYATLVVKSNPNMLKYALLIFLAIVAWPITITIFLCWIVYKIVQAIYRNYKKNQKTAKVEAVAPQMRRSLQKDRRLLVSVMVSVIKQHWDTLEDKFEQYVDEDDYGNVFVRSGLKQEFVYFSEKVVLPELERRIEDGETSNKSLTLVLQDTTYALQNLTTDYFGIKFEDSNQVIANKLLSGINDSHTDDDLLYVLHTNPVTMENYLSQTSIVFMHSPSITLNFSEKLKASQPITVTPFVGLVFTLFSAMHNSKSNDAPKKHLIARTFTGNDPYKYEEFIKELLRDGGFSAKRTRGSGDYGVDVIASKNGKTCAIQCKLYNHTVGAKAVQEIVSGRIYYRTDFAIVVSDNTFTDAARSLARKSDVVLTHHNNLLHKLENLMARTGEAHGDHHPRKSTSVS